MSDTNSCISRCALACAEGCAATLPAGTTRILLDEARARFRDEAQTGTCDTGRYRLNYFSWGSGAPLLFIHGVSDSSRSFLLPIARLSAHFRCIAYDLPCGRGDDAHLGRYTHAHLVEDVWALLDHLGLARSYVFASSFGSTIALAALRARPERLPRAILQGGLAWRRLTRGEYLLARLGRLLPGSMARLPLRRLVLRAINQDSFPRQDPAVWRHFLETSGQAPIAAFAHQVLLLHELDLRPILPEIRQPVLLVCGEHDPVIPPACTDVLLRGLPNAGRVVIEGCGHVPNYTHPEVLAEVVRRFLTPPGP
jgi:pimeloyl-ACP methyl ester carboxylesterase